MAAKSEMRCILNLPTSFGLTSLEIIARTVGMYTTPMKLKAVPETREGQSSYTNTELKTLLIQ